MNRYFTCFKKQAPKAVAARLINELPLDVTGPLPTDREQLASLQMRTARQMSIVNGQLNRILADYQYCVQRQNLRRALEHKKYHAMKQEELRLLNIRLQAIQQQQEDLANPPQLVLPPPRLSIVVGRSPSFKKEFPRPPTPIVRHE